MPSVGIARSASISAASGAVTNVGWNAVVPVASSASPTRTYPSKSVAIRSTPANPLTCRSTNPGAAIPLPAPASPTATIDPPSISTSREHAVDRAARQPHRPPHRENRPLAISRERARSASSPFTAPAVRAVIRCLRASTNTIATGSV